MLMEQIPGVAIMMVVVVSVDVEHFNSLEGLSLIHSEFLTQSSRFKETIQQIQTNRLISI
jgi:hypothetical protein